ncbi:MAG: imidazole glycerol phosphate synthase subunit HisH [Bacteroidaceae bacterium]|nr:imidazole glycerol phosphate synthase subunit HisH [Bacteroidaceae bacterium]
MRVSIIDYNAGNIRSVENALRRLGVEPLLTADHDVIRRADKVVFPGQGEASSTMGFLREKGLDEVIRNLKQPTLGICIGMQLMCHHSEEGDTECLGIFDVEVRRFQSQRHEDKIPQMGWNTISHTKGPLYDGFIKEEYVYFVHSYYVPLCPWTAAETNYIQPYSASICKDNFYATQFHPEKSGKVGERILQNFLNL